MNGVLGGLLNTGALIGFGNSVDGVVTNGTTVSITGGGALNFAFVAPRSGTAATIYFFHNSTAAATLAAPFTVSLTLYETDGTPNTFAATALTCSFTIPAGTLSINTVNTANATIPVPITAGNRYLAVASSSDVFVASVTGYVSGGINIL